MSLLFFPLWSHIMMLACLQCDKFSVPGTSGTLFFMSENKPANFDNAHPLRHFYVLGRCRKMVTIEAIYWSQFILLRHTETRSTAAYSSMLHFSKFLCVYRDANMDICLVRLYVIHSQQRNFKREK